MLGNESEYNDWELRYSMRSVLEHVHIPGSKMWVIGHKPNWLDEGVVNHVDHPDPYKSNKDANLIGKAIRISREPELSDDFIMFSDDHFVIKDSTKEDFHPYTSGEFEDQSFNQNEKGWRGRQLHTYHYLKKNNKTTFSCDCHIPYPCNKHYFPELMSTNYGYGKGYTIFSLYYNWVHLERAGIGEPLRIDSDAIRGSLSGYPKLHTALKKFENNRFINYDNDSLKNWYLAHLLESRFPEPAPWELDNGGSSLVTEAKMKAGLELWNKHFDNLNVEHNYFRDLGLL